MSDYYGKIEKPGVAGLFYDKIVRIVRLGGITP